MEAAWNQNVAVPPQSSSMYSTPTLGSNTLSASIGSSGTGTTLPPTGQQWSSSNWNQQSASLGNSWSQPTATAGNWNQNMMTPSATGGGGWNPTAAASSQQQASSGWTTSTSTTASMTAAFNLMNQAWQAAGMVIYMN